MEGLTSFWAGPVGLGGAASLGSWGCVVRTPPNAKASCTPTTGAFPLSARHGRPLSCQPYRFSKSKSVSSNKDTEKNPMADPLLILGDFALAAMPGCCTFHYQPADREQRHPCKVDQRTK